MTALEQQVGNVFAGRQLGPYELQHVLGEGGMSTVYRARPVNAERTVAVKVISEPLARHPEFVRHFEQEALAGARLQHPHILPVYEAGIVDGQPFIAMAYMPGGTLRRYITSHRGGLPLRDVVRITAQVAAALDYAHDCGIIHRDVKPGNVLLDGQHNAYLADFGIARLVDAGDPPAARPPGTGPYMAPEVLAGQPATAASDIYALGALVFEMLTGRRPFEEDRGGHLLKPMEQVHPLNVRTWRPDAPRGVRVVLEQALNDDPEARPASASALALALAYACTPVLPHDSQATEPGDNGHGPAGDPVTMPLLLEATRRGAAPAENDAALSDELRTPVPFADPTPTKVPPPPTLVHLSTVPPAAPPVRGDARLLSTLVSLSLALLLVVLFVVVISSLAQVPGY